MNNRNVDVFHDPTPLGEKCVICPIDQEPKYSKQPEFKIVRKYAHHLVKNHQKIWQIPLVKAELERLKTIKQGFAK